MLLYESISMNKSLCSIKDINTLNSQYFCEYQTADRTMKVEINEEMHIQQPISVKPFMREEWMRRRDPIQFFGGGRGTAF